MENRSPWRDPIIVLVSGLLVMAAIFAAIYTERDKHPPTSWPHYRCMEGFMQEQRYDARQAWRTLTPLERCSTPVAAP